MKKPFQIPDAAPVTSGGLTSQTIKLLRKQFAEPGWEHNPSPSQWDALEAIAAHLEAMAHNKAKPRVFLSTLDPGVGKTQTISKFTQALHQSKAPEDKDVGVIIFVSRREEIWSFIRDMGLPKENYTVYVSQNEKDEKAVKLNAEGNPNRDGARLLFTTQQMLEHLTVTRDPEKPRDFASLEQYYFHGKPRTVRIWDEACLRAREVTISVESVQQLETLATDAIDATDTDQRFTKLRDTLNRIIVGVRENPEGGVITLPDLFIETGLDEDDFVSLCGKNDRLRETIFGLAFLPSQTVNVVKDSKNRTIIHYQETKPADFPPYLITDASGRVKAQGTYGLWSIAGGLVKLNSSDKSYANMTTYVWPIAASKSAWKKNREELLTGIVDTIHSKGHEEEWVILYSQFLRDHFDKDTQEWQRMDIPASIKERVINPDRLHFVYWGGDEFRATNKFREVRNVLLASNHFLPEPAYQALARAALGWPAESKLRQEMVDAVKQGEHASNILQAVCRSSARKSKDHGCGECSVYIVAAKSSGIPEMINSGHIFPGATVKRWFPTDTLPKGKPGEALKELDRVFANPSVLEWPFSAVAKAIEQDPSHFTSRTLRADALKAGVENRGLEIVQGKGRREGVFRRTQTEPTAEEAKEATATYNLLWGG